MKNFKRPLTLIGCAALLCLAGCSPAERQDDMATGRPEFKTMIRMWSGHHNDTTLTNQLVSAFRQYPKACDEVWFGADCPYLPMEVHRASAANMAKAAQKVRQLGIKVSMQAINIGHPGGDCDVPLQEGISWRTLVGPNGNGCKRQYCFRDPGLREHISKAYATYAEAVHPETIWVDDDLRLTLHGKLEDVCYCDGCISEFNQKNGTSYTREALVKAMDDNADNGELRLKWRTFSTEGLAETARLIAREVHKASPQTQMGYQAVNLISKTLEAYSYMELFDAMREETGIVPGIRPGNGFYYDYEPRGMFEKAFDITRRINRISPDIIDIAPEIEGHEHRATGKSPHCLPVETMLYLAMGATQMSYLIIGCANEPMQWYADNYFRELGRYHDYCKEYADYNFGCKLAGVDPYLSPDYLQNCNEQHWKSSRNAGDVSKHCTLGIPFSPESPNSSVLMVNTASVEGISPAEAEKLLHTRNMVFDTMAWKKFMELFKDAPKLTPANAPEGLQIAACYLSESGKRIAVVKTFGSISGIGWDLNNAQRLNLINVFDWASEGKLPVIEVSSPQLAIFPRVDKEGKLRSVLLLNCTISDQSDIRLRLRIDNADKVRPTLVYKQNGKKDVKLKAEYNKYEAIVTVPFLEDWETGWIAVKY